MIEGVRIPEVAERTVTRQDSRVRAPKDGFTACPRSHAVECGRPIIWRALSRRRTAAVANNSGSPHNGCIVHMGLAPAVGCKPLWDLAKRTAKLTRDRSSRRIVLAGRNSGRTATC